MQLFLTKENFTGTTPEQFLMRCGYARLIDHNQISYARRLGNYYYPRFHIYIQTKENQVIINLHLDQKQVSYLEGHAHNADYDGQEVKNEIDRIKNNLNKFIKTKEDLKKEPPAKIGFFKRLFSRKKY